MVVWELHSPRIWAEQAGNGMNLSKVQTLTGQFSPIRVQALALWQPPLLWLYPSYMSWQTQRSLIMLTVFSGNRHRSDKISLINQLKISLIFVSVNLELTLKLRHTLLYDNAYGDTLCTNKLYNNWCVSLIKSIFAKGLVLLLSWFYKQLHDILQVTF